MTSANYTSDGFHNISLPTSIGIDGKYPYKLDYPCPLLPVYVVGGAASLESSAHPIVGLSIIRRLFLKMRVIRISKTREHGVGSLLLG